MFVGRHDANRTGALPIRNLPQPFAFFSPFSSWGAPFAIREGHRGFCLFFRGRLPRRSCKASLMRLTSRASEGLRCVHSTMTCFSFSIMATRDVPRKIWCHEALRPARGWDNLENTHRDSMGGLAKVGHANVLKAQES